MLNNIQKVNSTNAGLCPHGLPPSACPICSNKGGGGMRAGERPQKAGEMSYHECVMMGIMMRQKADALKKHQQNVQNDILLYLKFQKVLASLKQNFQQFVNSLQNNFFFKPVIGIIKFSIVPIFKSINVISNIIKNIISNFKEKIVDIMDKLNAIYGEAKAFFNKKSENIKEFFKSKLINVFKVFSRNNTDNDDTEKDDDKKIFNLKIFFKKILSRNKKENNDSKD